MTVELDLSGTWEILPVESFSGRYDALRGFRECRVPGHYALIPGFAAPSGKVVYRRTFKLKVEPEKRYFLRLNGVFYFCAPYLNGMRLGANEGYFFPVEHEITGMLGEENLLLLEVECGPENNLNRRRKITGELQTPRPSGETPDPGGIWRPVEIVSTGPVHILDPLFTTLYLKKEPPLARVVGRLGLDSASEGRFLVRISFMPPGENRKPQAFERELFKRPGVNYYQYELDLEAPELWWTHELGKPALYTLQVEILDEKSSSLSDRWETSFGVRTFEMRRGKPFLNDRAMEFNAALFPPPEPYPALMSPERWKHMLSLAKKQGINLIRVRGHITHPGFYEACDEEGVLVWQDFPLQGRYEKSVESQALRQAERMVFHLGNHPSIVVWCIHDRPLSRRDPKKPWNPWPVLRGRVLEQIHSWNRDHLAQELARRVRFVDPSRFTISGAEQGGGLPEKIDWELPSRPISPDDDRQ